MKSKDYKHNHVELLSTAVTRGTLHDGQPVGSTRSINGIQTYYVKPRDGSADDAILLFTDAMGIHFENNRLLADSFAANGYFVAMPDLFRGDAVPPDRPPGWSQTLWFRNHLPADVEPIVRAVADEMRKGGARRIAGVGYSIGAKYLARFMKAARISVAFMGHPAWVEEEDVLAIDRPISIAFGGDGCVSPSQRQEMEKMFSESGLPFQLNFYSDVPHGFCVRHLRGQMYDKFAKEQAFLQAVQWLNFWMREDGSSRGRFPWK